MEAKEFLKKVDAIIERLPNKINKNVLRQAVLEMLLSRHVAKTECKKIRGLMKKEFTAHSSIEDQFQIQAEIETLCNNI